MRDGRRRTALLFLAVGLFGLMSVAAAGAAVTRPYTGESFGPEGTESATVFGKPGAIAVDASDGTVYVADTAAGAVFRFTADGEVSNFPASTPASNELEGFGFISTESGTSEMAVDGASETLYVADLGTSSVKAFKTNGEESQFATTHSNRIAPAEGEVCGVAVDSAGDIYVGAYEGGVTVFEPTGAELTHFSSQTQNIPCNLAVDASGAVYVAYYPFGEQEGKVEKFAPSTFPVTTATTYASEGIIDGSQTFGLSLDPAADQIYANEGSRVSIFDPSGKRVGTFGDEASGALGESEGVAVGSEVAYASQPGSGRVEIFGPTETLPPPPPTIAAADPIVVGASSAQIQIQINPHGGAGSYEVEYGTNDCDSGGCTVGTAGTLGESEETETFTAELAGLQPGVTYHFRVVADNGTKVTGPDRILHTFPSIAYGPFELPDLRAYELVSGDAPPGAEVGPKTSAGGLVLNFPQPQRASADGEAVSFRSFTAYAEPSGAPGASQYVARRTASGWTTENIGVPDATSQLTDPVRGLGPDLTFAGLVNNGPPLAPGAQSGTENLYLRDNLDRSLTAITTVAPRLSNGRFCVTYIDATADGSRVFFGANGALTPEAPEPADNLAMNMYEWTAGGGIRLVNIATAPAPLGRGGGIGNGEFVCGSPGTTNILRRAISTDGSHVVWTDTEGASEGTQQRSLWSRVDGTKSIQLDKAKAGAPGPSGGGYFGDASTDGSKVFFVSPNRLTPASKPGSNHLLGDLYLRDLDTGGLTDLTGPLSSENSDVLGVLGSNDAGTAIYFVARAVLTGSQVNPSGVTAQGGNPNLYLWRAGAPMRFIATLNGGSGLNDSSDWARFISGERSEVPTSSVTPDGDSVVFNSDRPLVPDAPNQIFGAASCAIGADGLPAAGPGCQEVYIYRAADDSLVCASCSPSGTRPVTQFIRTEGQEPRLNSVPPWAGGSEPSRVVSPDGSRVFFESLEALLPRDTNGKQDIYEFERVGVGTCTTGSEGFSPVSGGCVSLISGGASGSSSYLVDASEDGNDVFISTTQSLVGSDGDENYDVYDVRVGGGFPEPAAPPLPCDSETGCRSVAQGPPAGVTTGSSSPAGLGNFIPPRCGKQVKGKHCSRRKQHRHRKHKHRPRRHPGHKYKSRHRRSAS